MKSLRIVATSSLVLGAALLAGCATTGEYNSANNGTSVTATSDAQSAKLAMKEAELRKREAALDARAATLANENTASAATAAVRGNADLPPNPEAGECYARVYVKPQIATTTKKLLVKEASESIRVIPEQYAPATEKVLVEEATEKVVIVPAEYGVKTEKVLVAPAKTRLVEVPAVYNNVTEKVLVHPARKIWKQGVGPIQRVDSATGEIMCLVEEPAVYKTITKRVVASPASTKKVTIPAQYKTVTRKVVVKPAMTRRVVVPAKYDVVNVTKLVKAAQEVRVPVPAQYKTVTEEKIVSPGRAEWRSILCETNSSPRKIREIQSALASRGFYKGQIDGIIGSQTMTTVNNYQASNNLPKDQYLNVKTLRSLGVSTR